MVEILRLLSKNHQTLSIAESCTGGALAHEITKTPGISNVFLGSITAYANQVKESILHIPNDVLTEHGAVSEQVALLMAKNCQKLFSSTWSLSTTGIAGPTGATLNKPLGLVWIGISGPNGTYAKDFIFEKTRLEHRQKTVEQALSMLKLELATKS